MENKDYLLKSQSKTQTAILDKQVQSDTKNNYAHNLLFSDRAEFNHTEVKNEQINKVILNENSESLITKNELTMQQKSEETPIGQEKIENETDKELHIDINSIPQTEFLDNFKPLEKESIKPKKSYSFRIKLLSGVYCILVVLFGGWIIGNAIDIANTYSNIFQVEQSTQEYKLNLAEYLLKISQLDESRNEEDMENNTSLIPIDEIIPVTPKPLKDETGYETSSNWFDNFCNYISKLFGG